MNKGIVLFIVLTTILSAGRSSAAEEASSGPQVTTCGYVDAYFSYNPAGVPPVGRVFDVTNNAFRTSMVGYSIIVDAGQTGGRIDLVFGEGTDLVAAGNEEHKNFQQAFGTLKMGRGTLDIGKFVTHLGYEVIPTKDNANVTRSFLFAVIPFDHTGVRYSTPLGGKAKAMMCLVNSGWAAETALNGDKSLGVQLGLNPGDRISLLLNGIYGSDVDAMPGPKRTALELIVGIKASEKLSTGIEGLIVQKDFSVDESVEVIQGMAGYATLALPRDWSFSGRVETMDLDDMGSMREGTLTLAKRVGKVLLRTEFRVDRASDRDGEPAEIYVDADGEPTASQSTFTLGSSFGF